MFGHQDEPSRPVNSPFAVPDATADNTDSALDAGLNDIVNSTKAMPPSAPTAPSVAAPGDPVSAIPSVALPATQTDPTLHDPIDANRLLDIKQQALQQLSPLVDHLDQSAEEKFRTTMMMIQASDNQELIGSAYAAAQAIEDEKAKAQALLDLVNEINYFTQRQK